MRRTRPELLLPRMLQSERFKTRYRCSCNNEACCPWHPYKPWPRKQVRHTQCTKEPVMTISIRCPYKLLLKSYPAYFLYSFIHSFFPSIHFFIYSRYKGPLGSTDNLPRSQTRRLQRLSEIQRRSRQGLVAMGPRGSCLHPVHAHPQCGVSGQRTRRDPLHEHRHVSPAPLRGRGGVLGHCGRFEWPVGSQNGPAPTNRPGGTQCRTQV